MLDKSLSGEEIARELINVFSTNFGIGSNYLIAAMRDRASANNVAMKTLKIVYPSVLDIGCFSHTLDLVGNYFKLPNLTEFLNYWLLLFSHSVKCKFLWQEQTGRTMATYSHTRWWSKWELMNQILVQFGDIKPFLLKNTDIGPSTRPKLLNFFEDSQKLKYLKIELVAVVDWGEAFVKATYNLKGDGPLALTCYETIQVETFQTCKLLLRIYHQLLQFSSNTLHMLKIVLNQHYTTLNNNLLLISKLHWLLSEHHSSLIQIKLSY